MCGTDRTAWTHCKYSMTSKIYTCIYNKLLSRMMKKHGEKWNDNNCLFENNSIFKIFENATKVVHLNKWLLNAMDAFNREVWPSQNIEEMIKFCIQFIYKSFEALSTDLTASKASVQAACGIRVYLKTRIRSANCWKRYRQRQST